MTSRKYQYSGIDSAAGEIRLLIIHPDVADESLKCSLETVNLRDKPSYEALSYAWGSSTRTHKITLDDFTFPVTRSLGCALPCLRHGRKQRCMWIDAICINQGDPDERSQQVAIMQDIYRLASQVVIWLGDNDEPEDKRLVEDYGFPQDLVPCGTPSTTEIALAFASELNNYRVVGGRDSDAVMKTLTEDSGRTRWACLARLFARSWFTRLWILQEAALACERIVYVGRRTFTWDLIVRAASFLSSSYRLGYVQAKIPSIQVADHVHDIEKVLRSRKEQASELELGYDCRILALMFQAKPLRASESRDHIYALLGLAIDAGFLGLNVDYKRPVVDVFLDFCKSHIIGTGTLDVLTACEHLSKDPSLPSWCPEWDRPWASDFALEKLVRKTFRGMGPPDTCAAGETSAVVRFLDDHIAIGIQGLELDQIELVCPSRPIVDGRKRSHEVSVEAHPPAAVAHILKQWYRSLIDHAQVELRYGSSPDVDRSFHFMVMDKYRLVPKITAVALRQFLEEFHRSHHIVSSCMQDETEGEGNPKAIDGHLGTAEVMFESLAELPGFQLFITKTGFMGLAHGNVGLEVDDEIAVLYGGKVPFALRKHENHHLLLGPVYLQGIMNGETLGLQRRSRFKREQDYACPLLRFQKTEFNEREFIII